MRCRSRPALRQRQCEVQQVGSIKLRVKRNRADAVASGVQDGVPDFRTATVTDNGYVRPNFELLDGLHSANRTLIIDAHDEDSFVQP